MSILTGNSKSRNSNRKESTDEAANHHQGDDESNISKDKMQNNAIGLDKEIIQGKKFL